MKIAFDIDDLIEMGHDGWHFHEEALPMVRDLIGEFSSDKDELFIWSYHLYASGFKTVPESLDLISHVQLVHPERLLGGRMSTRISGGNTRGLIPDGNSDVDVVRNLKLEWLMSAKGDYLISEDLELVKCDQYMSCQDQIMTIRDATVFLGRWRDPQDNQYRDFVATRTANQLKTEDTLFNSLREDYPGFDEWLERCRHEKRDCFVIPAEAGAPMEGLCILKQEESGEYGLPKRSLKICTFKISEDARGQRLGELLLKSVFDYALRGGYHDLYSTAFEKNTFICHFFEKYGFVKLPDWKSTLGEAVFVKEFPAISPVCGDASRFEYFVKYGPKILPPIEENLFLVPIKPMYHERLFPEIPLNNQMSLFQSRECSGNCIQKAYLSHSQIRRLVAGDVCLFYVSEGLGYMKALGVVEKILISRDADEIVRCVGQRTVYSREDVENMCRNGEVLVLLFRQATSLREPLLRKKLEEEGIRLSVPQSVCAASSALKERILRCLRG